MKRGGSRRFPLFSYTPYCLVVLLSQSQFFSQHIAFVNNFSYLCSVFGEVKASQPELLKGNLVKNQSSTRYCKTSQSKHSC